jgi:spermidine synthase
LANGFTYLDPWTKLTKIQLTVTHIYESFESEFQTIDVFETRDFGTVLALGGVTNVTDRDESSYHELLAHAPMFAHPNPKRVLIIGGGDGGTLREVLRHDTVEEAVLVDIDGEVIRCARQYFPELAASLDHPKATVIVGDGLAYVAEQAAAGAQFDVILIDSTDPVDAAVELFTREFYEGCATLLGDTGILVPQSDSPTFCLDRVADIYNILRDVFGHARLYLGQTVMYPGGYWAFCAASRGGDIGATPLPLDRIRAMEPELRYFSAEFAQGMFALPLYVRRAINGETGPKPTLADTP